jgi:hypothetical protein
VVISAPPITKARLGSQVPATSKKLSTLAGLAMPEMAMPVPKITPMRPERRSFAWDQAPIDVTDDEDGQPGRKS